MARVGLDRILVDANVLLSYLLKPEAEAPPAKLIRFAFRRYYPMLVAAESIAEIRDKVLRKPYLADRISQTDIDDGIAAVTRLGEMLPAYQDEVPAVARDRKDDDLLAQSVRANADVLVTGDEDPLVLGYHKGIWIMSPAEFVAEFEARFSL